MQPDPLAVITQAIDDARSNPYVLHSRTEEIGMALALLKSEREERERFERALLAIELNARAIVGWSNIRTDGIRVIARAILKQCRAALDGEQETEKPQGRSVYGPLPGVPDSVVEPGDFIFPRKRHS